MINENTSSHAIDSSEIYRGQKHDDSTLLSDASEDVMVLGQCILESRRPSEQSEWVSTAMIGSEFHSLSTRRQSDGPVVNQEARKKRFQEARETAIRQDYVELGRKKLNSSSPDPEFVPFSKTTNEAMLRGELSTETYIRLLPPGEEFVFGSMNSDHELLTLPESDPIEKSNALTGRYLFCSNFPVKTRVADLLDFFEGTLHCPVEHMELEHFEWNDVPTIAAHIRFVFPDSLRSILKIAKHPDRLRYQGRIIYASLDHTKLSTVLARTGKANMDEGLCYQRTVNSLSRGSIESSER
jgi:hypothetical protein